MGRFEERGGGWRWRERARGLIIQHSIRLKSIIE
jgi:hypothetical protein